MSEWISVNDRLPERGQDVLVNMKSKEFPYRSHIETEHGYGNMWRCTTGAEDLYYVSHWKPLDDPPEFGELPTKQLPEFISVDTALPENGQNVAVVRTDKDGNTRFVFAYMYRDNKFVTKSDDFVIVPDDVTSWLPIDSLEDGYLYVVGDKLSVYRIGDTMYKYKPRKGDGV